MATALISDIVIGEDRQRTADVRDHVNELALSIQEIGLIQPIVLVEKEGAHHLVAGYCRLHAIKLLDMRGTKIYRHAGSSLETKRVPFIDLKKLDDATCFKIELEENIRRKKLSWPDEAAAIAKLHAMRSGEGASKKQVGREIAEVKSITEEAGKAHLAQALLVEQYKDVPQVKGASTMYGAYKAASRMLEQELHATLSKVNEPKHLLFHGDSTELMFQLVQGRHDIILTDPPYGESAHKWGVSTSYKHNYNDTEKWLVDNMERICVGFNHCLNEDAHLYLFCSFYMFPIWAEHLTQHTDLKVWDTPLIWDKGVNGNAPYPDYGPRKSSEYILYARQGDKKVTSVYSDVIQCNAVIHEDTRTHAAQKPVALYENLLKRSTVGGSQVLDPFAGSGTIFEAAHNMNCTATGIEADEVYYKHCLARIGALK